MSRGADGIVRQSRLSVLPRILNPIEARAHESDLPPPEAFRSTDFSKTLWLPSRQIENTVCGMKEAGKLKIEFAKYTPNTTEIGYIAKEPAWLVLNEIHMPGWHAQIDNKEIPLLRGNGMFRAMCVPAGSHRLSIAFSPLRFVAEGWRAHRQPAYLSQRSGP